MGTKTNDLKCTALLLDEKVNRLVKDLNDLREFLGVDDLPEPPKADVADISYGKRTGFLNQLHGTLEETLSLLRTAQDLMDALHAAIGPDQEATAATAAR